MNEYQKIFYDGIIHDLNLDTYFDVINQKILSCFDIEDYKKLMQQRIFGYYPVDYILRYDNITELVLREYIIMLDFEFDSFMFITNNIKCSVLDYHIIIKIQCYNPKSERELKEYDKFKSYIESLPLWEKLKEQGFIVDLSYKFYDGEENDE